MKVILLLSRFLNKGTAWRREVDENLLGAIRVIVGLVEGKSERRCAKRNCRGRGWRDRCAWPIVGAAPELASQGYVVQYKCFVASGLMALVIIPDYENALDC